MATTEKNSVAYETFGTTSPVTGSAPTAVDGSDGQHISGFTSMVVTVQAASGKTLSGAGTLDCYYLGPTPGPNAWSRLSAADLTVTGTGRSQSFTIQVVVPRNSLLKFVPNGVTFNSGSAGVTVFQEGQASSPGVSYPGAS